jgi:hypothetical protein
MGEVAVATQPTFLVLLHELPCSVSQEGRPLYRLSDLASVLEGGGGHRWSEDLVFRKGVREAFEPWPKRVKQQPCSSGGWDPPKRCRDREFVYE